MKYILPSLLFIFVSLFVLVPSAEAETCVFNEAQKDNYFQQNVTGIGFPDNTTGQPVTTYFNNRYYATPEAAESLAQCLGGTVVSTPSGYLGGVYKPDTLEVVLPSGQTINAGDTIDRYFGTGANTNSNSYNYWLTNYAYSGSGNAGASSPAVSASAYTNSLVQYVSRLVDSYRKLFIAIQQAQSNAQLNTGTATSNASSAAVTYSCGPLTSDLMLGSSGNGVYSLTKTLVAEGLLSDTQTTFDTAVLKAVVAYQEKHAAEILAPVDLYAGTGFVGASTRSYINSHLSCTASSSTSSTPPASPASARYIKVLTSSRSWVAWREIEVYDTQGLKVAPASASAQYTWNRFYSDNQPHGPELVSDGNVNTSWNAGETNPNCNWFGTDAISRSGCGVGGQSAWIILDLGSAKQISKVRLLTSNTPSPATAIHSVFTSTDGTNFTPYRTFSGSIIDNSWLETDK